MIEIGWRVNYSKALDILILAGMNSSVMRGKPARENLELTEQYLKDPAQFHIPEQKIKEYTTIAGATLGQGLNFRLRIIKYLLGKESNPHEGAYISEVAETLKMSKGSAFVNLSELEEAGILVHKWELKKGRGTQKAVKVYSLNPDLSTHFKETIETLVKEL
jgi:hypothetical protein